jgi:Pup amidohydrolase
VARRAERPVRGRLIGLETEYAIRFTAADPGAARPGNRAIYRAVSAALGELVATQPGQQHSGEVGRVFTSSGATFCYEHLPTALDGGLLEGGTPECADPSQLLLYQKANDALLIDAIPGATARLSKQGFQGELAFLKNCRDAEGHTYGAQENYEAEIAGGLELVLYRVCLTLAVPVVVVNSVLLWSLAFTVMALFVPTLILSAIGMFVLPRLSIWQKVIGLLDPDDPAFSQRTARVMVALERVVGAPTMVLSTLPLRVFAFRKQRAALLGFLVSRPLWSGAGTVEADGTFGLSEKGPAIRRVVRWTPAPAQRPIFDTGNLMKDLHSMFRLRLYPLLRLYRARQRMQLGLSDSNCAQTAEYLKVAITALMVEMAEAGVLADAPRPRRPVEALHALARDASLRVKVDIAGGAAMTGLELQREYLARAKAYLRDGAATSLEAHRAVALWEEVLAALATDPGQLVGRIDWVSKRYLIEGCAPDAGAAVQKKIDLRYHELGSGYLAEMERCGIAPQLVSAPEVAAARRVGPEGTPARMRGKLVTRLRGSALPVEVSWDSVRIGGRLRGKVIQLVPRGPRPRG